MKALTSTEDYDLLVLGSGAAGNPIKINQDVAPYIRKRTGNGKNIHSLR